MKLTQKLLNLFTINLLEKIDGLSQLKQVEYILSSSLVDRKDKITFKGFTFLFNKEEYYVFFRNQLPDEFVDYIKNNVIHIDDNEKKITLIRKIENYDNEMFFIKKVNSHFQLGYIPLIEDIQQLLLYLIKNKSFPEPEFKNIDIKGEFSYKIERTLNVVKLKIIHPEVKALIKNVVNYMHSTVSTQIKEYKLIETLPEKAIILPQRLRNKPILKCNYYTSKKIYIPIKIKRSYQDLFPEIENKKYLEIEFNKRIVGIHIPDRAYFFINAFFNKERFSAPLARVIFRKYRHELLLHFADTDRYSYMDIPLHVILIDDEKEFIENMFYIYAFMKHTKVLKELTKEVGENYLKEMDLHYYFTMGDWDKYWAERSKAYGPYKVDKTLAIFIRYKDGEVRRIK